LRRCCFLLLRFKRRVFLAPDSRNIVIGFFFALQKEATTRNQTVSINTKLVFFLTLTVGAVMFAATALSLRQREAALEAALRGELRAHAVTLSIALEEIYRREGLSQTKQIAERLRDNSEIYAVLVFDENGEIISLSQPATADELRHPPELAVVLQTGETKEFVRIIKNEKFASVIVPFDLKAGRRGAAELIKPLTVISSDIFRARMNWLASSLLLLALIFLIVYLVTQRSIATPMVDLLNAAEAIGRGEFDFRVPRAKTKDELARLGREFNRMAERLGEQKAQIVQAAESRFKLEKELRHTERLASVGRLAAGIAHELGAPLNVIDARAEQLLDKPDADWEKRKKNLTIIRQQTERIARIVRQLLTLSRPFDFRQQKIDLNKLVQKTLEQFEENARNQAIKLEFCPAAAAPVEIKADRDYLAQVFFNIIQNALQAMPNGGTLVVATTVDAENAIVKFSDTGTGIAAEDLEKIFDPFYTTKDIGQGTGLGLAVSRRIVEEHFGKIEAANNENGGASFIVRLPLFAQSSAANCQS
jgi:two-component system NtrC family sensor kinase